MKTLVAKSLCNVIHGVLTGHSSPGTLRYIQKNIKYGTCEYIAIHKAISVLRKVIYFVSVLSLIPPSPAGQIMTGSGTSPILWKRI